MIDETESSTPAPGELPGRDPRQARADALMTFALSSVAGGVAAITTGRPLGSVLLVVALVSFVVGLRMTAEIGRAEISRLRGRAIGS